MFESFYWIHRKAGTKVRNEIEYDRRSESTYSETGIVDLDVGGFWDSFRKIDKAEKEEPDITSVDALVKCINRFGMVRIRWVADAAGKDIYDVIEELRGVIYCNPEKWNENIDDGWELADEYLSGNIKKKLTKARAANRKYPDMFEDNIEALSRAMPVPPAADEIQVTLGSPLPPDIIDDFINYIFKLPSYLRYCGTIYDEVTGSWEIPHKWRFKGNILSESTYGTGRISGIDLLEKELNLKEIKATDEISSKNTRSGYARVVNHEETAAEQEKIRLLIEAFKSWLWADEQRAERVRQYYADKFCYYVPRRFDGSIFDFPGLSADISLYNYEKDYAAAIILRKGCTLLALDTGAGKTFIMIVSAMELRRLGLAKRIMFVVPNGLLEQWRDTFIRLYPEANILCVGPKDFKGNNRNKVLEDIRDNDSYDGIIISYSCFDRIPLSRKHYIEELTAEKNRLLAAKRKKEKVTSELDRKIKRIKKKLGEAAVAPDASKELVCFDELGIDRLYIDEGHTYKNISIETSVNVLGIKQHGSTKCDNMMHKVHHVQRKNEGGGVVIATATPISNSVSDIYVMQKYLQSGELDLLELSNFDSWVGTFAEKETVFEIAVDTNTFRLATRFARFHNIPELTNLLSSVALFHSMEECEDLPKFRGYTDILIPKSHALKEYLDDISVRAERVHNHLVKRDEDNMLKITTDGRKAALDIRLVDPDIVNVGRTKVSECAERAALVYFRTKKNRSTQLIFCDTSTPKKGTFNIYDELRKNLIFFGVKDDEIAYIHDASTPAKREKLFRKMRKGEIRILIGSTFKLGTGVNIQNKLIALHHLDVPWKPAEMVQREGRMIRTGNENAEVEIYRYITEGSFDAYSWQLLQTKQQFITDILSGARTDRSGADVDDTVLNYAEVKALAIGNPDLKERVEIQNEISRLKILRKKDEENRLRLEYRRGLLPGIIKDKEAEYWACRDDACFAEKTQERGKRNRSELESEERQKMREIITASVQNNVMQRDERTLMKYRGFIIVLPAGMTENHPFIYLVRKGKYRVDMSDKEKGTLVRIDNYLDKLGARADSVHEKLDTYRKEQRDIDKELRKTSDYSQLIEAKEKELAKIDERLGVKHE